MRRYLAPLVLLMAVLSAHAATYTVNASQSTSTIQGVINGASSGDTVQFTAGTYSVTAGFTAKCGVTYTAVTQATPSNVVLSASFSRESTDIFNMGSCTSATTFSYLSTLHAGLLNVSTPNSNLTITHNQISDIPCCNNFAYDAGIYIIDNASTTANVLSNATITWNTIGDSASCTSPMNAMTLTVSPETFQPNCNGIYIQTATNGLVIQNNNIFHVSEGIHIQCYPNRCSPGDPGGDGPYTRNVTAQFNDFNQIHRIPWEEQPESVSGIFFQNNSIHDWTTPYFGSFGVSFACCANPASTSPYTNATSNVILQNLTPAGEYGYGMEAWGVGSQYNNNLVEIGNYTSGGGGIAWGRNGTPSIPWSASNNTVCGPGYASSGYVHDEGYGVSPQPTQVGNVTNATCSSPIVSVAPTISPASGPQTFPLTVTLTDTGYTSGAQPLGNTGIWYTTDGSTPVPGAGTATYLASGGTFSLTAAATVKAVGMWGAANQPIAYASGYGFARSAVQSATFTASGAFISPTGSDSNPGTLASPWLTPNHAMTCGQTITALSGTYSASNFGTGHWGTVTCAGGNNVAWLTCQTFDTCKITSTSSDAMWVDQSYWGVQGWENSVTGGTNGACFHAGPSSGGTIHHIIFANDVANGCKGGGFNSYDRSTSASVDYITYLGNVAYNAASGTGACYSGFNIYQPIASDTNAGTHMYIAGNFAYNNVDGSPCNAGLTTDGEGINLDTFDFSQGGGPAYVQQAVVQNNISVSNGSSGILVENNKTGSSAAAVYFKQNTTYGNLKDPNRSFCIGLGELYAQAAFNVTETGNLSATNAATGCSGDAIYGNSVANDNGTVSVSGNWIAGTGGNNTFISASPGFAYGTNTIGTNPAFTSTAIPGAPSCSGQTNVPACMAALIANFTPTAGGSTAYGYQTPSNTSVTDPLYPQWLCTVNIPSSLITPGCSGVTLSSVSIAPTAGQTTLLVGGTVQMITTCHYSDGSTSGCNTIDSQGNRVTSFLSSNGNVTVSSTGLATGAAIGTAVITAIVTGGLTTSPGSTLTVNANPLTLSSVSIVTTGGVSSIVAGATNQIIATCHYSDGSAAPCNTMDSHGNAVTTANSSLPSVASITSPGALVTGVAAGSTNLSAVVVPTPSIIGTSLQNVTGATGFGFINEIYGVTGTTPGSYTAGNCHIIIPATTNWVAGKLWTCLLVLGTPTTQNAAALCSNSFTMTGTSWPGGDIVISMAGCPALGPDQGFWVGSTTSQTQASPVQGFSNCNSSCNGAAPLVGSGTYPYFYVANTFGSYTSLPTTLNASGSPGQQVSQYIQLTTTPVTSGNLSLSVTVPPPSLVSAYLTAASGSMIVGGTMQMAAKCHYTSGPDQDCTVADIYGDAVSAWLTSDATKATVNNVGATNPGLVTAVAPGTPSIRATIGAATTSSPYTITISSPAVTLTGVSLSLTGGVTGLFVGATNQLKATCAYSDGSSDNCTTTDTHGNLAHSYVSTAPAHATVNAASGLVTGVAPGATTFTTVAGSLTSNPLPLAVFPVLSGIYVITVSGPVKFSGTVRF